MAFRPGNGVKLSTALVAGMLGVAAVAGLSVGISVEDGKRKVLDQRLNSLRRELSDAQQIRDDINVNPPNGKGFINFGR